jgi:hypothetical protein
MKVQLYYEDSFFGPSEVDYTGRWQIRSTDERGPVLYIEGFILREMPVYETVLYFFKRKKGTRIKAFVRWYREDLLTLVIKEDINQCGGMYG